MSLTGHELDNRGENESIALLEPEELKDEDEEADATQDGGQDHGGLDGLQIRWGERREQVLQTHTQHLE